MWTVFFVHISTHAPTEGSDRHRFDFYLNQMGFQPTLPPKGATGSLPGLLGGTGDFNPRSHRRERRPQGLYHNPELYFNPRSHRRERPFRLPGKLPHVIFQPTLPPKGATACCFTPWVFHVFQPTLPPKGATHYHIVMEPAMTFQPTLPPKGATTLVNGIIYRFCYFNPRSHRRERRLHAGPGAGIADFNPRSHRRERP